METRDPRAHLLQLATQRGVSLSSLSEMIGRNSTYLQQFIRKGSPRKLEETDRSKLARFFGVDEAELGAPTAAGDEPDAQGKGILQRAEWIDVPRLALGASAGPGTVAADELPIGALRFSARWMREQGLAPAMLSTIRVEGDSMEPTLRDGDEILVDRSERPLRDGIHVLRVEDALLVKRLDTSRAGVFVLVSDNPAYPPLERPRAAVEVLGRVVWKGGRL